MATLTVKDSTVNEVKSQGYTKSYTSNEKRSPDVSSTWVKLSFRPIMLLRLYMDYKRSRGSKGEGM